MIIEWIMWLKNKGQMDVCMSVCVYTYIYIYHCDAVYKQLL